LVVRRHERPVRRERGAVGVRHHLQDQPGHLLPRGRRQQLLLRELRVLAVLRRRIGMTVEKVIENGMTYRVETEGATVVKMKVEPVLLYEPVAQSVSSGDVVSIAMHLQDFDGEPRHDDLQVTFIVDGEMVQVTCRSSWRGSPSKSCR